VTLALVPGKTRVTIEVHAAGLLSAAAHDLRLVAEGGSGESADGRSLTARFPIAGLRVISSRRHGTQAWHPPSPPDAADIERRVRVEIFRGAAEVEVVGTAQNGRAELLIRAPGGSQRLEAAVTLTSTGDATQVRGDCMLSLRALGTGPVRVPFGAMKLEDAVRVEFDVVVAKDAQEPPALG
jgi:hypothetical protein